MPDREDFKPMSSLCWRCRNAVPGKDTGCAWSRSKQPVEGWKAQATELKVYDDIKVASFNVRSCPEYAPDVKQEQRPPVVKSRKLQGGGSLRHYFCPTCGVLIGTTTGSSTLSSQNCKSCGQKLEWKNKEDNSNGKNDV